MRCVRRALVFTTVGLSACGGGGTEPVGGTGGPGGPAGTSCTATTTSITVQNNSFSPACTKVSAGSTVTWTWADGAADHNVTFAAGQNSATQSSGTFPRPFPSVGTFTYRCTLHVGMDGEIRVQ